MFVLKNTYSFLGALRKIHFFLAPGVLLEVCGLSGRRRKWPLDSAPDFQYLRSHFNSQLCASFLSCIDEEPFRHIFINLFKCGLNIILFFYKKKGWCEFYIYLVQLTFLVY